MTSQAPVRAASQDGTYPRPQLLRRGWCDLSGPWDYAHDERTTDPAEVTFDRTIEVPFPPESAASGIGDTGFLGAVWYRRTFGAAELRQAGYGAASQRVLLHFGAVDHTATVWVNGRLVATHSGGQSPFTADITSAVDPEGISTVTVRAVDPPEDVSILRGKQDWREDPHSIWYHRTTGIWQPVWLECVPEVSIANITWRVDLPGGAVDVEIELDGEVPPDSWVRVVLSHGGERLAESLVHCLGGTASATRLVLPAQRNGQQYEELLWSPERPTLLDATVTLEQPDGGILDETASYLGLRSVAVAADRLLLNDRPRRIRAVLAQNYWPDTHLAATAATLRREVELILELGFNTARVHQKAEDPRFLYWADRLGLMLWAETANAYTFDDRAMSNLLTEWTALVRRDRSHPSIIAWVPLNESWGVQHIAHDPRQQAFSRSIADLTRALDGTRPVISNDGWEHTASDIWTIHDYESDSQVVSERYSDPERLAAMLGGFGPAGRRMSVPAGPIELRPVMVTEFGGVSLRSDEAGAWGYSTADDADAFEAQVTAIIRTLERAQPIAGYCYTQLTDTGQETNGLLFADRTPKFPAARVRAALHGE